ncbi:MAG: class I SAM-dependent methyltransferase [Chloroflexota bacterium]|nr:class I SAM-dependent methyltransferase [Chloroflexota bacterium]
MFNKEYFERVFEKGNSWGYGACEYEAVKYARQLDIIRRFYPQPERILEIGCAEGAHTLMLLQAFPEARVMGIDISRLAVERARQNCAGCSNAELVEADIIELLRHGELPPAAFDVIIQSESLYYLFPRLLVQMNLVSYLRNMTRSLKSGGIFVTANGINIITRGVMGTYYSVLGKFCNPLYAAKYREWNEFRQQRLTYDVRVFQAK